MSGKNNDRNKIVIAFVVLLFISLILIGVVRIKKLVIDLGILEAELEFRPTPTSGIFLSPVQAVRDYYALINQREYEIAWSRLSNHFKDKFNCCTPEGHYDFNGYKRWWDSVAWVDVGEIRLIEQIGNTAVVSAQLSYLMNNGNKIVDVKPYIWLVFDPTTRTWLFYDKGPHR